jgi:tetratricopeptide (TPR) repeat protein
MADMADSQIEIALDLIGVREATDKSSLSGDYLRHYESLFSHLRHERFNLIEIGVFRGGSARTWEQFFSKATIVGVDIDPACLAYATDRIKIEIGSQTDPAFLHQVSAKYPPLVVIDDGSHQSYDVIFSFERLYPTLLPGGIYVAEDLHFHLNPRDAERLRGGSDILAHDYFLNLARDRIGDVNHLATLRGLNRYIAETIDKVQIIGNAVIVHKKSATGSLDALKAVRAFIDSSKDWANWFNYSQKLREAGADDGLVAEALGRALDADPRFLITYHRLSETYERMGQLPEALATIDEAKKYVQNDRDALEDLDFRAARMKSPARGHLS